MNVRIRTKAATAIAAIAAIAALGSTAAPLPAQEPSAPATPVRDGSTVEIFDVRDLLPSNRERSLVLQPEVLDRTRAADAPSADAALAKADDEFRVLLATYVRALGARDDAKLGVEMPPSGALVVRAQPTTLKRVADFLFAVRVGRAAMVEVETRVLALDDAAREEFAKACDEEERKLAGEKLTASFDAAMVERFLAKRPELQVDSPKIVTASLRPFELSLADDVAYVAGMESVVIDGIGTIVDPVVKTIREGIVIEGMALAGEAQEGGAVPFALRLSLRTTVLKRPIATAKCDLGTFQIPETRHAELATTIAGITGSTFLVGGVPKPGFEPKSDGPRLYLAVTVRPKAPPGAPR